MYCMFKSSLYLFFFFKQKTAYEMRISDWSSDVCSSDLTRQICRLDRLRPRPARRYPQHAVAVAGHARRASVRCRHARRAVAGGAGAAAALVRGWRAAGEVATGGGRVTAVLDPEIALFLAEMKAGWAAHPPFAELDRSEEHTAELQSLM